MVVRVRVPLAAHLEADFTVRFFAGKQTLIDMKKIKTLTLFAAATLLLSSCSKLGALTADNFTVTPNPLETQAGAVPTTINGQFPAKYMKKKAVVTIVPELRYADGTSIKGTPASFQGEGVLGNDQTVSYLQGGNFTMRSRFAYDGCNKADLWLNFMARLGSKVQKIPEVKVATGVIATSELYRLTVGAANAAIAPDAYQRIVKKKQEANIRFLIQQANIRKSELKNNSVQEFVRLLRQINDDRERLALDNVEVSAYASPDGGVQLNDRLAGQRQKVSEQYVSQELKRIKMDAPVDARYTAQDWEGFQELVRTSNIQDKDIILRVLSMYKDPQEREQQIRNISQAFRELADGVLPQLRRSRLTINYETIGRSDEQILDQLKADPYKLSVEELLYAAALKQDSAEAEAVYKTTADIYPGDQRAFNNLAALAYARGDVDGARNWLTRSKDLPETQANLGLLALRQGDVNTAEQLIAAATGANGLNEILGNLHLAQGNYAQAEQDFGDICSNSAALAQILNRNYAAAAATLKYVQRPDAMTAYLRALLNSRMGNKADAATALAEALRLDPSLAAYADNDLELK